MRRVSRTIVSVGLFFAVGSCGIFDNLAEFESRQFVFSPTVQGVHHTGDNYQTGACLGVTLDRRGTGSILLANWRAISGSGDGLLLAGYGSSLSRGADPFPCNLWVHHQFQAKMFFDLNDLPDRAIVEDARLRVLGRPRSVIDAGVASTPCNFVLGHTSGLSTNSYSFNSGADQAIVAGAVRPGTTDSEGKIDVTRTVALWEREGSSDNWFVISIEDGRAFVEHSEDDEFAYCNQFINDVSLEISALVPPAP